jgi:hypothetical protein
MANIRGFIYFIELKMEYPPLPCGDPAQEDLYLDLEEFDGEISLSEDDSASVDDSAEDSDSDYGCENVRLDDTQELRPPELRPRQLTPELSKDERVKPATTLLRRLGIYVLSTKDLNGIDLLICTNCECVVHPLPEGILAHLRSAHLRLRGFTLPSFDECSAALTQTHADYNIPREDLNTRFPNYLPPLPYIKVEGGWSCNLCVDPETRFCSPSMGEMKIHWQSHHPLHQTNGTLKEYCYVSTLSGGKYWHIVREPAYWLDSRVRAAPKILHDLGFVILLLHDLNVPNLLVCTLCQCAVLPGRKPLHRHIAKDIRSTSPGSIPTLNQCEEATEAIVERYNVPAPINVPKLRLPNDLPPLPFIRHVLGWSCSLCAREERMCSTNHRSIGDHQRKVHPDCLPKQRRKERCRIATLFRACVQWYVVEMEESDECDEAHTPISPTLNAIFDDFDAVQETQIRVPVHNAFLVQVGWVQQYSSEEAQNLCRQVALPAPDDELMPDLRDTVSEYLEGIKACLESCSSIYLQPRRWINCLSS